MQLLPVGPIPLPHRALIELAVEPAKLIDPAIGIGKEHRASNSLGRARRCGLRPSRSSSIPEPGISQVVAAIVSTEKDDLVRPAVISHLRVSARGGRG